ncbi:MAG: hypothetical protein IPH73_01340 [Rhodocyclales bacterium]|jgi:hypothetical protein|nr:hypothetical protein [Rhodocyclales bacterium]
MTRNTGLHFTVLAAVMALSLPVLAAEGKSPPAGSPKRQDMQQQMKDDALKYIDDKIRILQEAKTCVRAAKDMKDMSDCHAQERRKSKALKEQARANVLGQKAKRGEAPASAPVPAAK